MVGADVGYVGDVVEEVAGNGGGWLEDRDRQSGWQWGGGGRHGTGWISLKSVMEDVSDMRVAVGIGIEYHKSSV